MLDKKILLAVSGSIAAFKSVYLLRLLQQKGAQVKIIMTKGATQFIQPLTFSALSQNQVFINFTSGSNQAWNNHVSLATWADIFIVAPATAKTISSMAYGMCNNLLLATYLSATCPILICPSMDEAMYKHPSIKKILSHLKKNGNHILNPTVGSLASGLMGEGRMQEPETIAKTVESLFVREKNKKLIGKKVLITASSTREYVDDIRYISNSSSGKMGFAMALAFAEQGAEVLVITGPTKESIKHPHIEVIEIVSASEMYKQTDTYFPFHDICVFSAAVTDYTSVDRKKGKIKKTENILQLSLAPTVDIAEEMGKKKQKHQITIGFALEENENIKKAEEKRRKKNLNYIVLNSLNHPNTCFDYDTNKVKLMGENFIKDIPFDTKIKIGKKIVSHIII